MENGLQYQKLFKDICVGCSKVESSFGSAYIKHITIFEQSEIEEAREEYFKLAQRQGLPTVEEALVSLYDEDLWAKAEENLIKQEELFVKKLIDQKKNTYLKSQIDSFNAQIEQSLKKINDLKNKRNSFLGNTCENFADQKMTENFIKETFYKDQELKIKFFKDDEFDELTVQDLSRLIGFYNLVNKKTSDLNIQKMVLQDFFSYYISYSEDPIHFFGKPVAVLSLNQIKTLLYARYFKNIFANNDKIPEEFKKDPEKIIDYVNANEKAKKLQEKTKDGQAQSIVGATKEDYEYLNMTKGNTKQLSLKEQAKKKGGSLDMKDLMELMGT